MTGADGAFTSGLMAPVKFGTINETLVFDVPGYGWVWWNLGNEVTLRPMEIQARPARVIEGVVTGTGGLPVEGAVVEATLQSQSVGVWGI